MLMLDAKIAEGQLLDQFLEALRELPEVQRLQKDSCSISSSRPCGSCPRQAELVSTLQPGGPDRGYDARVDLLGGREGCHPADRGEEGPLNVTP